ncbi:MAG: YafY family transcriptional regulator [Magnetospirillum sp.]|nr:YafY family transcriptional regulator [Magnetospirillum sp.]
MRRADRLFRIIQRLRRGRLVTAADLATALEVSERTIYRDMRALIDVGLPIEGEAGVGYLLRASLDLPPLTFSRAELEALVVGARLVRAWGGGDLAVAAAQAVDKIAAALPEDPTAGPDSALLFAPGEMPAADRRTLDVVREAINRRHVLEFAYRDVEDRSSRRAVWPLGLFFWGKVWTLAAWCELRQEFRNFRIDRMAETHPSPRRFAPVPGRTLADFIAIACGERDRPQEAGALAEG